MPETQFPNLQQKLQSQLSGTNGRLKFPLDNQDDYKGRIIFSVFDEDAARVQFGKALEKTVKTVKKGAVQTVADIKAAQNVDTFTGQRSSNPAILNTQLVQDTISAATDAGNSVFNRVKAFAEGVPDDENFTSVTDVLKINQEAGSVELYLPQQIQVQDVVSYGPIELGVIGAGIENALNTSANAGVGTVLSSALGGASQLTGQAFGTLAGTAQLSEGMAALAAQRIAKKVPQAGTESILALRQTTGITTNPNVRTQFQSVPVREFGFSFTLIPKSRTEAAEITKIIKWFRTELYPEALIAAGVHYGYKFPNRFQIKIKYGNQNDSQASNIRFLPVYLKSFSTNYNPNGMGMHSDGSFSEIQFNLAFAESRALNKQDVVERGF